MDPEKYERARVELIEAELENVQKHLSDASVAAGQGESEKAQTLLDYAKHAHEIASFHIEKLPAEETSLRDLAQVLHHNLAELEQQIIKR
jgi:hypothetical protein